MPIDHTAGKHGKRKRQSADSFRGVLLPCVTILVVMVIQKLSAEMFVAYICMKKKNKFSNVREARPYIIPSP